MPDTTSVCINYIRDLFDSSIIESQSSVFVHLWEHNSLRHRWASLSIFSPHCCCETARSRTKPRDLQIPFLFQLASKMVGTVAYLCVQNWMEIWGHPCPLKLLTVTRTRLRINTPLVFISGVLFWRLIQFLYWWVMWTRLPRAHDSPSAYSPGCV